MGAVGEHSGDHLCGGCPGQLSLETDPGPTLRGAEGYPYDAMARLRAARLLWEGHAARLIRTRRERMPAVHPHLGVHHIEGQGESSMAPREASGSAGEEQRERLLWVLSAATFLIFFQAY